jgi:hypothetical protein
MPRSKYGAVPTVVDNVRFASQKEARRYSELKLLQKIGEISALDLQPRYELKVHSPYDMSGPFKICTYVGDFAYIEKGGKQVVEDVKGVKTPVYRLKKRLMKAVFGIEVKEI